NKGDNRVYPDPLLQGEETIGADTLDRICGGHGISTAQFIKIDVQGSEASVVRGASGLLARSANCILMTEFWPYGLARCSGDGLWYLELRRDLGFQLYEVKGTSGVAAPVGSSHALLERPRGRHYANLVGLKGEAALKAVNSVRQS